MQPENLAHSAPQDVKEAARLLDQQNMLNHAIVVAFSKKGSLTRDEYEAICARTVQEWREKYAVPSNPPPVE